MNDSTNDSTKDDASTPPGPGQDARSGPGAGVSGDVIQQRPILLVEDDLNDVELTRWAFQRSGIANEMVVARDGIEAPALLHPHRVADALRPSMILMDVNMPRMGGIETPRRLRQDPTNPASTRHRADQFAPR